MQPGRTPSWNIVADLAATTWLEVVQLASDDRLLLPSALRKRVRWCETNSSLPLLATINFDGGASVAPLAERQDELTAIRATIEGCDPSQRAGYAFAAMATYSQISLQPDGRLRLSPALAYHLCALPGGRVWVGAHDDTITLWSESAWKEVLSKNASSLRDAVAGAMDN